MLHLTSIHRRYIRTRGPEFSSTTERLKGEIIAEKASADTRNYRVAERRARPLCDCIAP